MSEVLHSFHVEAHSGEFCEMKLKICDCVINLSTKNELSYVLLNIFAHFFNFNLQVGLKIVHFEYFITAIVQHCYTAVNYWDG